MNPPIRLLKSVQAKLLLVICSVAHESATNVISSLFRLLFIEHFVSVIIYRTLYFGYYL